MMSVYLDYNATAPMHPKAQEAVQKWLFLPANPSSVHSFGRAAKKQLEDSRKLIAEALSAFPNEIIFMASGTEANLTALRAFPERRILCSAIEHSSIIKNTHGGYISVDGNGVVDLVQLEHLLRASDIPALVSIMLANNETGVIQPINDIATLCKKYGALLHTDAVQALGKISVDFSLLGADLLTVSAHKCGGAVGAAALIVKNNLSIKPLFSGGGQELGRRSGTENIAAIAGFSAAIEAIDLHQMQHLRVWLNALEHDLKNAGGVVFAGASDRLPNTSCIAMPYVGNEIQLIDFDLNKFAVSAGSACSSGRIENSHVLLAMGVSQELASCAIRISAGWNTTQNEIEEFKKNWLKLISRVGR